MPSVRESLPYRLYNEDCFQTFKRISDASIDLVLCDPPYGTTSCKWDSVIDLERMWKELGRICKLKSPIVMTSSQPFTAALIASKFSYFKYQWVWDKGSPSNPQLAKHQPLKVHEDICVFCKTSPHYFPQGLKKINLTQTNADRPARGLNHIASHKLRDAYVQEFTNYPKSIVSFSAERGMHPTQKPFKLMSYLIKTYTLPGDLVLDFAMGSGTTGAAAMHLGRKFIGCDFDKDSGYFDTASTRIKAAYLQNKHLYI